MGLIQSAIPDPGKFLTTGATGYDPNIRTVNLNTDTVSGQLDSILKQDNPYITRARASAAQAAASRGLLNSTMGAQAGETAAIDAALPIATADANTFSTQRLTNQAATNTAKEFTAGATNTADLTNAAAGNQFGLIGSQLNADIGRITAQGTETRETQAQSGDIQARIAEQQGQIQTSLIGATGEQTRLTQAQSTAGQKELQTQAEAAAAATQEKTIQAQKDLQTADTQAKVLIEQTSGATKTALANLEADYKTLMQTSASAGDVYKQAMATMTLIMADANMGEEAKQTALDNQTTILRSSLNLIGSINGIDLTGLLPE